MAKLVSVGVKIGKSLDVKTARKLARESFLKRGGRAMQETQNLMLRTVQNASPNVSGATKQSWRKSSVIVTPEKITASVFSESSGALVAENGAKPHSPPPNALDNWIRTVKGSEISTERDLRSISFKIGKKLRTVGRTAKKVFSKAIKSIEQQVRAIVLRNIVRIDIDLTKKG